MIFGRRGGRSQARNTHVGESEQIDPDQLYVQVLDLLEAQGSRELLAVLRDHHRARGNRLFGLMTLIAVLPAFDEALTHGLELDQYLALHPRLGEVSFLVARMNADLEIAIEALLVGRQSVVADCMRDVMEIEMLFRDFARRPQHIELWMESDEASLMKLFRPAEVRRRLANDAFPGKGLDLPESQEYQVHSMGLHPSPQPHPLSKKAKEASVQAERLLFEAGEILEHGHRFFVAADELLDSTEEPPDRPPRNEELKLLLAARDEWVRYAQALKDHVGMPPRHPSPRRRSGHIMDER